MKTFAKVMLVVMTLLEIPWIILGFFAASIRVGFLVGMAGYAALLDEVE